MLLSAIVGVADIIKLKTETFARFCEGIPIGELPRTFVDAIAVAKHRYVFLSPTRIYK